MRVEANGRNGAFKHNGDLALIPFDNEPDFPNRVIVSKIPRVHMRSNDDGVSVFESVRPRLFGIAYRMLGSAAEAEDIVQDAWLRWQGTDRSAVLRSSRL